MIVNTRTRICLLVLGVVSLAIVFLMFYSSAVFRSEILELKSSGLDTTALKASLHTINISFIVVGVLIVLVATVLCLIMSNKLAAKITYINECLSLMQNGILPNEIKSDSKDEIGQIAAKLDSITKNLRNTAKFAHDIGLGNFNEEFRTLSDEDVLGHSLINMNKALEEADKREIERNWIVNGVAELGEILRNSNKVEDLSNAVTKYVIGRIGAVQGAFYIVESKQIHLKAMYAYNRKKFEKQSFAFGEGLIGQAAIEEAMVFRKEIPDDYESISSGILGDKKPTCILIYPLIANEKVYGVLEFAGLRTFEDNEIKFVEEVSPIIARTIFNIQVSERTQRHLEESQSMGAELQQQQEELRQNAEEMLATQEELKRTNQRLEEQIEEVNRSQRRMQSLLVNASELITIYEKDAIVKYVSPSAKNILGYDSEELTGVKEDLHLHEEDSAEFHGVLKDLVDNPKETLTIQYRYKKKNGEWIWLEATGKNLLNDPSVAGIVFNSRDITLKRKAEVEERMRKNMQALSENSPDLITRISCEGEIAYTNPAIEIYTGHRPDEFMNQDLYRLGIENGLVNTWKEILQDVKVRNEKYNLEVKYASPIGNRVMQVNVIPEYTDDEMESVLVVSHDVTERKQIELEIQAKNKNINESINYSKRIQNAILPDNAHIQMVFPKSFMMYKPRDVVSGDFPWFAHKDNDYYIAVVDCTGHGVPGAMLSLVGYFQLNNIVDGASKGSNCGLILDQLDHKVNETLIKGTGQGVAIKDGMDIGFCKINLEKMKVEYAGAHRPLYLLRDGEIQEFKGDKWAIGGGVYKNQTHFTNHEFKVKKGDAIFFFSDGLPDQFGGPLNRKMGSEKVKNIIEENKGLTMNEMSVIFEREFDEWRGESKQTDDVLLIGIEF